MPFVVVLNAAVSFYIHISRLARHTQDILADPKGGLMIAEADGGAGDPLRLARVCIEGVAAEMAPQDPGYAPLRGAIWRVSPTPPSADFSLFRIASTRARYVAGFGRIFDLSAAELVNPNARYR